jgi:hypothetical protein
VLTHRIRLTVDDEALVAGSDQRTGLAELPSVVTEPAPVGTDERLIVANAN